MKKILLSLLLAGGVQNSFAMQAGGAAQDGGQAAESSFRLEGQVPVAFEDGSVVYLDLQRLKALNSGLLEVMLFTAENASFIKELSESNPFAMTRFENLAAFEKFEKILQGQLSGEIADKLAFIEHVDFLDIDWLKHLRELKKRDLKTFFALYTALLADKIDLEEPRPVKHDFIILLEKVFPNLLVEATKSNEFEAAKMLIATGADVNARDLHGRTLLMLAADNGYTEIAKLLIDAGADVNIEGFRNKTALILAAQNGHVDVVRALITALDGVVDAKDIDGWTALMYAAEYGRVEVVRALIDAGANVNVKSNIGWTALMCAAQLGRVEVVQELISKKADVNAKSNEGLTALMYAAENRDVKVVRALIATGANIMAQNAKGNTALMIAAKLGNVEVVRVLIEQGANVNMQNAKGDTALMSAAAEGNTAVVILLIEAKADLNAKSLDGGTALIYAAKNGYLKIVNMLLRYWPDLDAKMGDKKAHEWAVEWDIAKGDEDHTLTTAIMLARGERGL